MTARVTVRATSSVGSATAVHCMHSLVPGRRPIATMSGPADVVVIGASNTDLTSYVDRLPVVGETLHGHKFQTGFGGKGANQCVASARIGAATAMITMLGEDLFGRDTLDNYKRLGIATEHVHSTDKASTGVAPIAVDAQGRNAIIIVNGANDLLDTTHVEAARPVLEAAKVVVGQLEVRPEVTLAALRIASKAGVTCIFNAAPARETLEAELYTSPTIFCVNESEAQMLTGVEVTHEESALAASLKLRGFGARTVILTLGARGSYVMEAGAESGQLVPAKAVEAVDTSGAGDAFIGALAFFLSRRPDMPLAEQVRRSGLYASVTVQAEGTQTSFPDREAMPKAILE